MRSPLAPLPIWARSSPVASDLNAAHTSAWSNQRRLFGCFDLRLVQGHAAPHTGRTLSHPAASSHCQRTLNRRPCSGELGSTSTITIASSSDGDAPGAGCNSSSLSPPEITKTALQGEQNPSHGRQLADRHEHRIVQSAGWAAHRSRCDHHRRGRVRWGTARPERERARSSSTTHHA
jgi:hypothetical protein